eukprot:gb/GFBE01032946.1/.p1 GENE.gb/GFBE01032946.1/~~gb/GFBE01032946.1/.p1  ORF type:complete len:149 (+),score=36.89 gb/GFBE01032946.1/:1-447(+)
MAQSRRSLLGLVLILDAVLLCSWCISSAFVSAPGAAQPRQMMAPTATAAALALTSLPGAAQAVEKWQYNEPGGDLSVEQIQIFLWFFLIHAAGIADFYAKKTGAGPAVPINIFRSQQFFTDKGPLFGYNNSFFGRKDPRKGRPDDFRA